MTSVFDLFNPPLYRFRVEQSPPHLYTTREVADHLRISPRTLRRLVRDKKIACVVVGKRHRFLTEHISAYLKRLEVSADDGVNHGVSNAAPRPRSARTHRGQK